MYYYRQNEFVPISQSVGFYEYPCTGSILPLVNSVGISYLRIVLALL